MTNKIMKQFNIRTFVLECNNSQLHRAYGTKRLIDWLFPTDKLSHELHHNCLLKEIAVRCNKISLIKVVSLTYWWIKLIKYTKTSLISYIAKLRDSVFMRF